MRSKVIEYRKHHISILWILVWATGILLVTGILSQVNFNGGHSASSDLQVESDQAWLEVAPRTIAQAKAMNPKSEGESEEAYEERLQKDVNIYNKMLEEKKSEIRSVREAKSNEWSQMIATPLIVGTVLLVIVALIINYVKSRQPIALVLTENYIEFKGGLFREENRIYWDKIAKIEYHLYRTGSSTAYSQKMLYFMNVAGKNLESINLRSLEISDFNTIHRDISRLAPDINWVYPNY